MTATTHTTLSRRRSILAILLTTLGLLASLPARGEDPGTSATEGGAPAIVMTPPKLLTFVEAKVPADLPALTAPVEIELDLVVGADGKVASAKAVDGPGDAYEAAAIEAVTWFRFAPAEKAGVPIPSRIHYRYVFTPPAPTTGTLEGRVLARGGDIPVAGATVRVAGDDLSARTDAQGRFAFPTLPPGDYKLAVDAPGMLPLSTVEHVAVGEATALTMRLDPVAATPARIEGPVLEFGATARIEAPAREVTKRTLSAEELVGVAGTRGDALRVIELMPGVARPPGAMGVVIVRGSAPQDSVVQLEGMPVPHLYHFGGLTSFVQGRLLDRIDLYPGNFSVRYGQRMGGVVDVGLRDPKSDAWHGMGDVNIIDASVLAEGPVGKNLSLALAFRRSYIDAFFSALANSTDLQVAAAPVYYDYQAMLAWKPTAKDHVRAFVFGTADSLRLVLKKSLESDPTIRGNLQAESALHRLQIGWKRRYSDAVEHDVSIGMGPLGENQSFGDSLRLKVDAWGMHARAEWRVALHRRWSLVAGIDHTTYQGKVHYRGPRLPSFEGDPDAFGGFSRKQNVALDAASWIHHPGAYLETAVIPVEPLRIVAGLRADHFTEIGESTLDPRMSARYEIRPGTVLKGGAGRFSQPPEIAQSIRVLGNPELTPARAWHYSLGVEHTAFGFKAGVEGFHKRLENLFVSSTVPGNPIENGGIGRIWGAEFSLRSPMTSRGYGFVSYTLSRSKRNDHGVYWRRFDFDQPHILTASGTVRVGGGVEIGSTFRFVSGNPFTPVVSSTYDANLDLYRPVYGRVNTDRNNPFVQLDVRVEKVWTRGWGKVAAYLDVQNATNRRNAEGRYYNFDYSQSRTIPGLPIIPSLGLRGEI